MAGWLSHFQNVGCFSRGLFEICHYTGTYSEWIDEGETRSTCHGVERSRIIKEIARRTLSRLVNQRQAEVQLIVQ